MTLNANAPQASAPAQQAAPDSSPAPTGHILGSTEGLGLCRHCGSDQLDTRVTFGDNAMPLFCAGVALGVLSVPFMLVYVGFFTILLAIPLMLAPLMTKKTSVVCNNCHQTM